MMDDPSETARKRPAGAPSVAVGPSAAAPVAQLVGKRHINEAISEAYEDARVQAAAQTHLNQRAFPARCPFSWTEIMERDISWPPDA